MTTNLFYSPPYCPEHPKEQLKTRNLIVKSPFAPEGEGIPFFHYCPKSKKYLSNNKLVSRDEAALNAVNNFHQKNYSLSEIEVLTSKEYLKSQNTNI